MDYTVPVIGFLIGIAMLLVVRFLGTIGTDDKKGQPAKKKEVKKAAPVVINGTLYAPVDEKKKKKSQNRTQTGKA